jgi:hypothetical protein
MAACERPEFPVPEQRPSFQTVPRADSRVVSMDEPGVEARIVRDIAPKNPDDTWRWTGKRPAIRVRIRTQQPVKYVIDFTIPDLTLRDTGPVTIAFTVNDHELGRVRYDKPGDAHFEKPVPPEWIVVDGETIVGAEIDKLWTAPLDGAKFGFIISRMGLAK